MAIIHCLARHDQTCYGCGDPTKWNKQGLMCIDCRQFKIVDTFARPQVIDFLEPEPIKWISPLG